MTAPREWLAALTTPTRGVMNMAPGAWDHCPATTERVRVREVLATEPAPLHLAPLEPDATMMAAAAEAGNAAWGTPEGDDNLPAVHHRAMMAAANELAANWTPTPENINALPLPIRQHIHDLGTRCDPAGEVVANAMLRDHIRMLEADNERLRAAPAQAADVATTVEDDMTALARELGAFYSDLIPHNAGLFIPGEAKACGSPAEAIRRLFEHVRVGGLIHKPLKPAMLAALGLVPAPAAAPEPAPRGKQEPEPAPTEQPGLF